MRTTMMGLLTAFAVAAFSFVTALPASAVTFNETISTVDKTNGYTISLFGLTTDPSDVAQSLSSGNIVGFGSYSYLTNVSLSLITPSSTEGGNLQGSAFNFDGKAFLASPYYSNSGSSGIVLADILGSTYYLNPYLGGSFLYDSISVGGATPSNPGDLITVSTSETPLPGALPLFASAIGGGILMFRRKKKAGAALKSSLEAA